MEVTATSKTWRRLLDDRKEAFAQLGHPISPEIVNETALRSHFESLCREHGDKNPAHSLFKLYNNRIDAFTSAIDTVSGLRPRATLTGLALGGSFVVSQIGCNNARVQPSTVAELLGCLNHAMPRLGADISRFPQDPIVQESLQDIFSAYVKGLLFLARYFSIPPADFDPSQPQKILDHLKLELKQFIERFHEGRDRFEAALQRAEQETNQNLFPARNHHTNGVLSTARYSHDTEARFKTLRRLGRGSFGQVDEVEEMTTGNVYARKRIPLGGNNTATAKREEEIQREIRIMERLTHTHIITVMFWLRSDTFCSIIMKPACDMDLRSYLERCIYDNYPTDELRPLLPWFGCLLDALAFAHRLNVIHKDIKPSNILIKDNRVYLADFGLAKDDVANELDENGSPSKWGASVYRAPEIMPNHPHTRGTNADVFSLGCVFSEMLTVCGRRSLEDFQEARSSNESGTVAFRSSLPQVTQWLDALHGHSVNSVANDLILHTKHKMLCVDPSLRTSARESINALRALSQYKTLFCQLHY